MTSSNVFREKYFVTFRFLCRISLLFFWKLNESTRAFTVKEVESFFKVEVFLSIVRCERTINFTVKCVELNLKRPESFKSIELTIKIPKTIENNFIYLLLPIHPFSGQSRNRLYSDFQEQFHA